MKHTAQQETKLTEAERLVYARAKAKIARSIKDNAHLIAIWPGRYTGTCDSTGHGQPLSF